MFKSSEHDKSPLSSKKFLAYLFSNIVMKIYAFFATMRGEGDIVVMTAIISTTFLDVGYILGQASLDRYVRVAEIMAGDRKPEDKPKDAATTSEG